MNKITVLYDYQIFVLQKFGGISRYYKQLIDAFKGFENIDVLLPLVRSRNYYVSDICKPNIKKHKRIDTLLNCIVLFMTCWKKNKSITIIHPTYYYPKYYRFIPLAWRKKSKFIITVHDLICELFYPDMEPLEERRKTILNADGIIAISEFTKKDLLKVYPELDPQKISVIYHGVNIESFKNKEPVQIDKQFILFVGQRGTYKNGERYMRAIGRVAKENREVSFVFAGGNSFTEDEKRILQEEEILERCLQINVKDEELYYLYGKAICFVFPSLYEGFGIPILEAYSCECPVLLSNSSCFPEIAQDAAVYFDGQSIEDMSDQISKIINDERVRGELIEKGKERIKFFTSEKTAKNTLDFYKKISLVK